MKRKATRQEKVIEENETAVAKLKEELQIATKKYASTSNENEVSLHSWS